MRGMHGVRGYSLHGVESCKKTQVRCGNCQHILAVSVHLKIVSHASQRGRMRQKVALLCVLTLTIEAIVFEACGVVNLRCVSGHENA